jgi:PAS domain S-box-containing protein
MLGYDPAQFHETNAAWLARLHPDDRAAVGTAYRDYIAGRLPEYRLEFRQRTRSGHWKWILSLGRIAERDVHGWPLRMLGTHTDITARKEAAEALRRTELRQLTEQRVTAERTRIARDLHDDLGNRLSEIQILAERIAARKTDGAPESALAGRLGQRAVAAVEALDELVWLLNSKHGTWTAMVKRLRRETSNYLGSAGIAHDFVASEFADGPVEPRLRQTALMALREMLRNALVHGRPPRITVQVAQSRGRLTLSVADDGPGFDGSLALAQDRGLAGLEARAREHGGTLRIQSKPGRTVVSVSLRVSRTDPPGPTINPGNTPTQPWPLPS